MKANDKLFSLIKSLNQSEKRYFKRFSKLYSSSKKNNYLKLFEFIDKSKFYDVSEIRRKFKNDKFSVNLSVTKDYLYKLILKSMRSYHDTENPENILLTELMDVNFLMNKSSPIECKQILDKVQSKAIELEKHTYAIESLIKLRKLQGLSGFDFSYNECERILQLQLEELNKLKNYCNYLEIEGKYKAVLVSNDNELSKEELNFKDSYSELSLILNPDEALTKNAKFLHYYINIHKLWVNMKFKEYYIYCKTIFPEIYKLISFNDDNAIEFLKILRNLILSSQIVGDYNNALQYIEILKNIISDKKIKDHTLVYYSEINYYKALLFQIYFTCDFNSLKNIQFIVDDYLHKNKLKINKEDKLDCSFILSVINFINNNFDTSIKIINSYADDKEFISLRFDVILISYSIRIISYYEKQEYEFLEYHLNTILKKIRHEESILFSKFTVFVKHFKKIIRINDGKTLKENFYILKNNLEKDLDVEPLRQRLFNIYFVINWLNSKINEISISEELKKRNIELTKN